MVSLLLGILTVAPPLQNEAHAVAGTVVDSRGEPVPDARVMLPLWINEEHTAFGRTDTEGNFELTVPKKWIRTPNHNNRTTIWVLHPNFAIGVGSAWQSLFGKKRDSHHETITLEASQTLKIVVKDPAGAPVPNINVEPFYTRGSQGYEWIPEGLRNRMRVGASERGLLLLTRIRRDKIFAVRAVSKEFGTQEFRIPDRERNRKIDLQLAAVGTIEGRFTADNPAWLEGASLHITSRFSAYPKAGRSPGQGISGVIKIGPDGTFKIPAIAAGALMIDAGSEKTHPARLKLPSREKKLEPGKTLRLEIPLIPATPVRGRVVDSDNKPVPDATVSIRYGQQRQHDHVQTDKDGFYSGFALPGSCYTQVISADAAGAWEQKGTPWNDRFDVPDQREVFALPEITLLRKQPRTGILVDQNDRPLGNYSVIAVVGNKVAGRADTDSEGKFKILVAAEEKPDSFSARSKAERTSPRLDVEVIREEPTLRLRVTVPETP